MACLAQANRVLRSINLKVKFHGLAIADLDARNLMLLVVGSLACLDQRCK